jgi:hypothetical protein
MRARAEPGEPRRAVSSVGAESASRLPQTPLTPRTSVIHDLWPCPDTASAGALVPCDVAPEGFRFGPPAQLPRPYLKPQRCTSPAATLLACRRSSTCRTDASRCSQPVAPAGCRRASAPCPAPAEAARPAVCRDFPRQRGRAIHDRESRQRNRLTDNHATADITTAIMRPQIARSKSLPTANPTTDDPTTASPNPTNLTPVATNLRGERPRPARAEDATRSTCRPSPRRGR